MTQQQYTQEDLQAQGIGVALNQGVPLPTRTERAEFVDKTRPEPLIEEIRHKLLMEYYDRDSGKWLKMPNFQEQAWSEFGAWQIATKLNHIANINITAGNISEEMMLNRIYGFVEEVLYDIGVNFIEYGYKNDGQIYDVKSLTISVALGTLSQAKEGHTSRTWRETTVENRQVITAPQQQTQGRLKTLLFGNK